MFARPGRGHCRPVYDRGLRCGNPVRPPEDVAHNIPCGPDAIVEGVRPFWEARFTDVALVQIGGDTQERFLSEVADPLLEKLRTAAP